VSINAPVLKRYKSFLTKYNSTISLENFLEMNDQFGFSLGGETCMGKSTITFINNFDKEILTKEIENHPLIKEKQFRPDWDRYYMKLAHVVKERSNCMKRSVGSIIVKSNRIVSTGYNGVPGQLKNCYQGGCKRCNDNFAQGVGLDNCNCLHAEEGAVCEVSLNKSKGATIYITLSPCRWCVKVIIAVGITRVVYDEKYNHDGSMELLQEAGIKVDCININP